MTPPAAPQLDTLWILLADDGRGERLQVDASDCPCIADDQEGLDYLMSIAEEISAKSRQTVRLVKFTKRQDVRVFTRSVL
jgi:hypothetical protein